MRALVVAVAVVAAACTSDTRRVATSYAHAAYCPDVRIHATAFADLVVWDVPAVSPARWPEPALPADVARDPARLAVWQADRDAAYRRWQRAQPPPPRAEAYPVFAVGGCGAPALYTCRDRRRYGRQCEPLDAVLRSGMVLACADATAVRFEGGGYACGGGPALDVDTCDGACAAADARCVTACRAARQDGCERSALGASGLCGLLAPGR
jgi:hypothetical protein